VRKGANGRREGGSQSKIEMYMKTQMIQTGQFLVAYSSP
jgi:hypothetical protein